MADTYQSLHTISLFPLHFFSRVKLRKVDTHLHTRDMRYKSHLPRAIAALKEEAARRLEPQTT